MEYCSSSKDWANIVLMIKLLPLLLTAFTLNRVQRKIRRNWPKFEFQIKNKMTRKSCEPRNYEALTEHCLTLSAEKCFKIESSR